MTSPRHMNIRSTFGTEDRRAEVRRELETAAVEALTKHGELTYDRLATITRCACFGRATEINVDDDPGFAAMRRKVRGWWWTDELNWHRAQVDAALRRLTAEGTLHATVTGPSITFGLEPVESVEPEEQ